VKAQIAAVMDRYSTERNRQMNDSFADVTVNWGRDHK
jgi:hypothetical protein